MPNIAPAVASAAPPPPTAQSSASSSGSGSSFSSILRGSTATKSTPVSKSTAQSRPSSRPGAKYSSQSRTDQASGSTAQTTTEQAGSGSSSNQATATESTKQTKTQSKDNTSQSAAAAGNDTGKQTTDKSAAANSSSGAKQTGATDAKDKGATSDAKQQQQAQLEAALLVQILLQTNGAGNTTSSNNGQGADGQQIAASGKNALSTDLTTTTGLPTDTQALATAGDTGSQASSQQGSGQDLLTTQLQELIKGNDTGKVTITRQPTNKVTLQDLNTLTQQTDMLNGTGATEPSQNATTTQQASTSATGFVINASQVAPPQTQATNTTTKPVADQTSVQQAPEGQFLAAKLKPDSQKQDSNNQSQQNTQHHTANSSTSMIDHQSTPTSATEQSTPFAQFGQQISASATPTTTAPLQTPTATTSPGILPQDASVLQQVVNKIQIQPRQQDTQLNIKLHPAQLGELQIDLTYKEGAIRAHVYAQTQHAQEILERHMPRLKELLTSQGMHVQELLVSAKSDTAGNFDLLQQQFSQKDSSSQEQNRKFQTNTFGDSLDDFTADPVSGALSGVNLTV